MALAAPSMVASGRAPLHARRAWIDTYQQAVVYMRSDCGVCRAEVLQLDSLSAHADRSELLGWVGALPAAPRRIFVTHGEPVPADSLRQAIEERHGWPCTVPEYLSEVELA